MNTDVASGSALGPTCPRCKAPVFRVSRRLVDVLISVFLPVRRYRCRSMSCGWEGNFRVKGLYSMAAGQGQRYGDSQYHLIESSQMGRDAPPEKASK